MRVERLEATSLALVAAGAQVEPDDRRRDFDEALVAKPDLEQVRRDADLHLWRQVMGLNRR